jgi:serine/threonine-protein kinase
MHGDIKAENIFVGEQGHVTLLDLGFARRESEIASAVDRPVLGTVNYMAPELVTSSLRADIRSDIYSLGVTLFELLTGRLPVVAADLAELAEIHRQLRPVDVRRLTPGLPLEVARLVRQMMAKEPLRRPQTPRELIERLTRLEVQNFSFV